jgi:hypothetical protein
MSLVTSLLGLPLVAAAQAQKHVTHNEALLLLDALAQIAALTRSTAPPASPVEGERRLVAPPATGAFAGHEGTLALFVDGAWRFLAPQPGWLAWLADERRVLVHDGTDWVDAPARHADRFGVAATPDATNRLAVASAAALFSHAGAGMQLKLNKASAADTGALKFQTNWSGRAEFGLAGDDDIRLKVSADGALWREAMRASRASAAITFPFGVAAGDRAGFRNLLRNPAFAVNQRAVSGAVTLAAGAHGHDGAKGGSAGAIYTFATTGLDTTLTITAGSLILPVETRAMAGGVHTLAHDGTAQARVWQGTGVVGSGAYASASRANGGLVTGALGASVQTNVEFSTGTVLRPQFEAGAVATAFEQLPPSVAQQLCMRYFQTAYAQGVAPGTIDATASFARLLDTTQAWASLFSIAFPVPMRATPTVTLYSPKTGATGMVRRVQNAVDAAAYAQTVTDKGMTIGMLGVAGLAAGETVQALYTLSAEI